MTCPDPTPVSAASLPWQTPAAPQTGKCTDADLAAFNAKVPTAATDADLKGVVSPACAQCIFSDAGVAGWAPLPETNAGGGAMQPVTVNLGGCYASMTGSTACGKALQNHLDCGFTACADCADDAAFAACLKAADGNACSAEAAAITSSCGAIDKTVLTNADNACQPAGATYLFEGPIRVACILKP